MALVEKYHVVASSVPVDPNTLDIKEGMLVAWNGANGVRRVTTGDIGLVYGVAGDSNLTKGDSNLTNASAMPGVYDGWQNRVTDGFDETKASGKITVYHSGGEFATDQFVDPSGTNMTAAHCGHYLLAQEATGKLAYQGATRTVQTVAQLTRAAGSYPSGVPGTDLNGDMKLKGDNSSKYVEFKLLV